MPREAYITGVIQQWDCPACDRSFPLTYRPGRPRLYCSHACRQRAYRWRCRHDARSVRSADRPLERARAESNIPFRRHALRSQRDPMSRRRDILEREVTVCGVLARPARYTRSPDPSFRPDATLWTCQVCARLTDPSPFAPAGSPSAPPLE
jgi:hypothetical protein